MYKNNKDIGWEKPKGNGENGSYDDSLIKSKINEIDKELKQLKEDIENDENEVGNFATEDFVRNEIEKAQLDGGDVDLSGYATKDELNTKADVEDIPTKVSQLENDSNYLTSIPSEYITETELNDKGYLTEHQDISGKANKSDIPTKTSQLTNDSDFATNASVDEKIANINAPSLEGNTLTFGNYTITYNETDDTLDFIYNGVIEEPVVSNYVSEGLSLYIDASDVATHGSIRDITGSQTITNNGASITSDNEYLNFVAKESDYIETGLAPNLTQWSVETYFYFTTKPTTTQIAISWGASGNGVRIGFRDVDNAFIVRLNSNVNYPVADISNFTSLCHLIITMNNGTVTSYFNGVKTVLGSNASGVQTSQAETLKIGTKYDIEQFTNMNLKSFRFYNGKVLSDEEALQNYNYEINRR